VTSEAGWNAAASPGAGRWEAEQMVMADWGWMSTMPTGTQASTTVHWIWVVQQKASWQADSRFDMERVPVLTTTSSVLNKAKASSVLQE